MGLSEHRFRSLRAQQAPSKVWGARQMDTFCLFRLYCPKARAVELLISESFDSSDEQAHSMQRMDDGNWHIKLPGKHTGSSYAFRITHAGKASRLLHTDQPVADPYSPHVATINHYVQHSRSLVPGPELFNWDGDTFVSTPEPRNLVIYETHLKDLTAHPSSEAKQPGTYLGAVEPNITGGIQHLKKLGINAVEFLPLQKFAGFEPPFDEKVPEGYHNTWNPYARNHWGYMTSFFFAPETLYATGASNVAGEKTGCSFTASRELKEMVRCFHREGISVILDVVYNHVSQYDLNPLKYIDKEEFFRLDPRGRFLSESGCGNDLRTQSPYIRKLIADSIIWWMKEYHIDGFRFDLANLIDRDTIREIKRRAEKVNPNVLLIAEPWGGGYDPLGFSAMGWASWNDQIRNGVKGYHPTDSPGFIFGKWHHENSRESLENFIRGTLVGGANGRFHHARHAVNYLESHDGYTLGDFIRIALDPQKIDQRFRSKKNLTPLGQQEMKCSRLAAMFLFVSQGIVMLHAGQEWGRSKWISADNPLDPNRRKLDHNSYEKDNATNYLDYSELQENKELFHYYEGLIRLRKSFPQFRLADPDQIRFLPARDARQLTFLVSCPAIRPGQELLVSLNGDPGHAQPLELPEGSWKILADEKKSFYTEPVPADQKNLSIPPTSGIILIRHF